jgi:predicted transcriptional regulator
MCSTNISKHLKAMIRKGIICSEIPYMAYMKTERRNYMIEKNNNINLEANNSMEDFRVSITNPMMYDRLHTLSVEYSVSVELLVNLAVKRLVDDVDFVRSLRVGDIKI